MNYEIKAKPYLVLEERPKKNVINGLVIHVQRGEKISTIFADIKKGQDEYFLPEWVMLEDIKEVEIKYED